MPIYLPINGALEIVFLCVLITFLFFFFYTGIYHLTQANLKLAHSPDLFQTCN